MQILNRVTAEQQIQSEYLKIWRKGLITQRGRTNRLIVDFSVVVIEKVIE